MDTSGMPKMGELACLLEVGILDYLKKWTSKRVECNPGTGIIVVRGSGGYVFKIEITQVDGPQ